MVTAALILATGGDAGMGRRPRGLRQRRNPS
jgi:hypothetical protein